MGAVVNSAGSVDMPVAGYKAEVEEKYGDVSL